MISLSLTFGRLKLYFWVNHRTIDVFILIQFASIPYFVLDTSSESLVEVVAFHRIFLVNFDNQKRKVLPSQSYQAWKYRSLLVML